MFKMGCVKCLLLLGVIITIVIGIGYHNLTTPPDLPKIEENYWGPGMPPSEEDTSIRPFKINITDEVIDDLKRRLENTRQLTPPLEGIQQQYGMNAVLLKEILEFWKSKYNWKERQQFLNQFPQFKTKIQGLDIHYLHVKPKTTDGVKVLPLLLIHGWPGSVRDFYEMLPLLTTPQNDSKIVFEVITPSLPGYGFSQATVKPGLSVTHMSIICKNLMERLGFKKYYVQGGIITANMARLYPDRVLGAHSNMCFIGTPLSILKLLLGSFYPSAIVNKKFEKKMYPLSTIFSNFLVEIGYVHMQSTKPDTIGIGLTDSPAGLAAYILEKLSTWTNPEYKERLDGGLGQKFTFTKLLDNVMIYWVTGSITTSMRLYSETFNIAEFSLEMDRIPIKVPTACIKFMNELTHQSDYLLKENYMNMVHSAEYEDGGHFAAFEVPEILAKDIFTGIKKMEDTYV